jgi:hypothetical protein
MALWPGFVVIVIVVMVAVVAKIANSLNELNAMKNKPGRPTGGAGSDGEGGSVRQTKSDMDRFLAEIDRLRKKNADTTQPQSSKKPPPVAPVVQPAKQPQKTEKAERPRARVVAEHGEPVRQDTGFAQLQPAATTGPKAGDLPVATVVSQPGGTGAPATKVTRLFGRPRPVAKTPFAKTLTGLLNSGQGLALAIVLQEILGPPKWKSKKTI